MRPATRAKCRTKTPQALAAGIGGAKLRVIAEAGRRRTLEQPELANEARCDFLLGADG